MGVEVNHRGRSARRTRTADLAITSEIGRLREAIVHTPGREVEMVTPRNFGRMLMDDILYLKAARQDHEQLVEVLKHAGVHVHQVRDLLSSTLVSLPETDRSNFIDTVADLEGCTSGYRKHLHQLPIKQLAEVCITGELHEDSLMNFLRQDMYDLSPLSNLMFVRDAGAVVHSSIILSNMAHSVRARESLIFELIFRHHELFRSEGASPKLWLETSDERRNRYLTTRGSAGIPYLTVEGANFRLRGLRGLTVGGQDWSDTQALMASDDVVLEMADLKLSLGRHFALEGGNVIVLSKTTLLVGCNDRTSPAAIQALAREMLTQGSPIKTLIVAIMPPEKSAFYKNLLDTGFALLYHDSHVLECLIHHRMIDPQGTSITVVKITSERGRLRMQALPDLRTALQQVDAFVGVDITFIPCGADESGGESVESRISQEREWHHQAVNVIALAPGKIVAFRRNQRTIGLLQRIGYEVIPADGNNGQAGFLQWTRQEVADWLKDSSRKSIIAIRDEELSRAHGGPRSLVLPLRRDTVPR